MKKTIFFALLLTVICCNLQAQKSNDSLRNLTDKELGMHYLKQSSQQKTIAWILLGGGLVISAIGANQITNDLFEESSSGEALFYIGTFASIGSIPLFISAAKNKGRAEILLRNQNIPLTMSSGSHVISVGLAIPLGK